MPHDDHRAPSRLASTGRRRTEPVHPLPPVVPASQRPSSVMPRPFDVIDDVVEEVRREPCPPEPVALEPHPTDPHRPTEKLSPVLARESETSHLVRDTPGVPTSPPPSPNGLSNQERHQILMHAVQLYDDEWRLGAIRANAETRRLTAYLIPRNKRLDLKTAISKQQVLMITVDQRGNTDIKEPKKRGVFRSLASWLRGE